MKSVVRPAKVLEIKALCNQYGKLTREQRVRVTFDSLKSYDDAPSIRELALGWRPLLTEKDKDGEIQPTDKSIRYAKQDILSFRNDRDNHDIVPYPKMNEKGQWFWYNFQLRKEIQEIEKMENNVAEGTMEILLAMITILGMTKRQRQKITDQMRYEIVKVTSQKKKKKRNAGQ